MITSSQAATIMQNHEKEIIKECRACPRGFRVLVEVDGDGGWRGVGRVTPGTGSLLAHERRGYAAYFDANRYTSYSDVSEAIQEWQEQETEVYGG